MSHVAGSIESDAKALSSGKTQVEIWLDKLAKSYDEEKEWLEVARKAVKIYDGEEKTPFNLFFSNVETIVPALYSATPKIDVRRRFQDEQETDRTAALAGQPTEDNKRTPARMAATVLERAVTASLDMYDFDEVMIEAIRSHCTAGRGIVRVRYQPYNSMQKDPDTGDQFEALVHEETYCEPVPYDKFRRGPARSWASVPWEAFCHDLTAEEVERLIAYQEKIKPTASGASGDERDANPVATRMKKFSFGTRNEDVVEVKDGKPQRGIYHTIPVWEIWDRSTKTCFFISEQDKTQPILVEQDPLGLRTFFPAKVLQRSKVGRLVPICPYETSKPLLQELERVTKRITALTAQLQVKGIADGKVMPDISTLRDMVDGEFVAAQDASQFTSGASGGFERAIMFWPIEKIIQVLTALYQHRDIVKQTIFEETGIADILRGATNPNETLGAQQIKATWGSQRVRKEQAQVQRFARDILRLKAEILSSKFQIATLSAMTNIPLAEAVPDPMTGQVTQDPIVEILRSPMIDYVIDVETDSTIAADSKQELDQMAQFTQAAGQFMQVMPAIAQTVPQFAPGMTTVFTALCRKFKLGKDSDEVLDGMVEAAKQMAAQAAQAQQAQQQPQQPDPAAIEQQRRDSEANAAKSEAVKVKADADKFKARASVAVSENKLRQEAMKVNVGLQPGSPFPQGADEELELVV